MGEVTIRVAGTFAVSREPAGPLMLGSRKARILLARLAAARGRVVGLDELVAVLWPATPPRRPAENVATLVSRLRGALGAEAVLGGRTGYRLGVARVDVDDAAALLAAAGVRLAAGDAGLALVAARRGLELVGDGQVLAGEPAAEWVDALAAEVSELLRSLRHALAEAATAAGDPGAAVAAAGAATEADPLDERGHRLLMAAHRAAGEPGRALAAFARLRAALAAELGAEPGPETRDLHLAILRGERAGAPRTTRGPVRAAPRLVGRNDEAAALARAWSAAAAGAPTAVLVAGEAGIGKTALAEALVAEVTAGGGLALQARCYAAERSLFLQPVLDALKPALRRRPAAEIGRLAGASAGVLAALLPESTDLLGAAEPWQGSAELGRRRAYDAVRGFLVALAADRPVLLLLDDLHNAGAATVELLHYLARAPATRLLVLATLRSEEGAAALDALSDTWARLDVGPLSSDSVALLAARAGAPRRAEEILRRTRGHTLFVVETLRALAAGQAGVPETLRAAVAARLRQAGPDVEHVLRAGAVLGATVPPVLVAGLLDLSEPLAIRYCDEAADARLLVAAGGHYEFANDLVQEIIYAGTPEPMRAAYHRRAVALLGNRPEALARHAEALGEHDRAARAWLAAAEEAERRFATADARALLDRGLAAAGQLDEPALTGGLRLARARAAEALADLATAVADLDAAVAAARQAGDRGLEITALRRYAGDLGGAMHLRELERHLGTAARLATELADPAAEAGVLGATAVIAANRLRFTDAVGLGRRAVAAGRASGDDGALAAGLDGLKTAYAYLGDTAALRPVLAELEPLLRRSGRVQNLHWVVFESALPAVAEGDWDTAVARVEEALEINRRSGQRSQEAWLAAHRGWLERLRGRPAEAVEWGRRAVRRGRAAPHDWWQATAHALLATTLLELGETAEAVTLLRAGRALAERRGVEAYVLRCVAPLAQATGSAEDLTVADALLGAITAPPGSAWLVGGDAYLAVARTWLHHGRPDRARAALAPLLTAADRHGWRPWQEAGRRIEGDAGAPDQNSSASRAATRAAPPGSTGA